jgi:hypothetical protein
MDERISKESTKNYYESPGRSNRMDGREDTCVQETIEKMTSGSK